MSYFLTTLSDAVDFYSRNYDNIIILGDFNAEPQTPILGSFLELHSLYNHMKQKTCWKSASGSCIDLIISNKKHSLQHTGAVEIGLSDHHLLIYTMLKVKFTKQAPKSLNYRSYKNFNNDRFLLDLQYYLYLQYYLNNGYINYVDFEDIFTETLEKHAPMKTKLLRANNRPHVTKSLRKAIMKRSRLKNIANLSNNPEDMVNYRRQRNLVVNMNRKAKKSLFDSVSY